jgi:hypothetical protein
MFSVDEFKEILMESTKKGRFVIERPVKCLVFECEEDRSKPIMLIVISSSGASQFRFRFTVVPPNSDQLYYDFTGSIQFPQNENGYPVRVFFE